MPLRRGAGDPTFRAGADGVWLAANTPTGPGTLHVRVTDVVEADAWGDGAQWLLDGLPALLGDGDDDSAFECHHPLVAETRRRRPGIRLGTTGRVWDALLPAILEQKVTGIEAFRSYRELVRRFGTPAPGTTGLYVPPTPRAILGITDWEWHRAGVDGGRRRALIAAAQVAHRLERAAELGGEEGRNLLRKVPGIGVWTAAEVAQRAWGDPDAVSFGDYHLAGDRRLGVGRTGRGRRRHGRTPRPVHTSTPPRRPLHPRLGHHQTPPGPPLLPPRLPRHVISGPDRPQRPLRDRAASCRSDAAIASTATSPNRSGRLWNTPTAHVQAEVGEAGEHLGGQVRIGVGQRDRVRDQVDGAAPGHAGLAQQQQRAVDKRRRFRLGPASRSGPLGRAT